MTRINRRSMFKVNELKKLGKKMLIPFTREIYYTFKIIRKVLNSTLKNLLSGKESNIMHSKYSRSVTKYQSIQTRLVG